MFKKIAFILFFILFSIPTLFGTTYYVNNNGNDDASGLSDASAWKTYSNFNRLNPGDKVYFKAGDVWTQHLMIWNSGTENNPILFGSYYMQNGQEKIGIPSNGDRPIFRGSYSKKGDLVGSGNAVPLDNYDGLISIRGAHIIFKNSKIENSAAAGINIGGAQNSHNVIIENNIVANPAKQCSIINQGTHSNIVRNNEFYGCDIAWKNKDLLWQTQGSTTHGYPACNSIVASDNNLFENNYIHECYGEIIGVNAGSKYNIIRKNIAALVRSSIRIDNAPDNIIEQNIIFGQPGRGGFELGGGELPGYTAAFSLAVEDWPVNTHTLNVVYRNNIMVNTDYCITLGIMDVARQRGMQMGGYFVGNTCINPGRQGIVIWPSANHVSKMVFKNNIIDIPVESVEGYTREQTICSSPNDSEIKFDGNVWGIKPADPDCLGTNDRYGEVNLKRDDWSITGPNNHPSIEDFELEVGSIAIDSGVPLTQRVLDASNFPQYAKSIGACESFDETISSFDFHCNSRTGSSGAIEYGSKSNNQGTRNPGGSNSNEFQRCDKLNSGTEVPLGYGASFDFDSSKLILEAKCNSDSAKFEVGEFGSNMYVYKYAYAWKNNNWERIELGGEQIGDSSWLLGEAYGGVGEIDTSEDNFVLGYVCKWTGSEWKCGCRDSSCSQNFWNLQIFKK